MLDFHIYDRDVSIAFRLAYVLWKTGHSKLSRSVSFNRGIKVPENLNPMIWRSFQSDYILDEKTSQPKFWTILKELKAFDCGGCDQDSNFAQASISHDFADALKNRDNLCWQLSNGQSLRILEEDRLDFINLTIVYFQSFVNEFGIAVHEG